MTPECLCMLILALHHLQSVIVHFWCEVRYVNSEHVLLERNVSLAHMKYIEDKCTTMSVIS